MEKTIELQTLDEEVLHHRRRGSVTQSKAASDFDRDRYELARVGKQQVLKVCDILKHGLAIADVETAPVRTGVYDWAFLWSDVHLGKLDSVRTPL